MHNSDSLERKNPAFYFPLQREYTGTIGVWEPLEASRFGNGDSDARLFQFDCEFPEIRAVKQDVRRTGFARHVVEQPPTSSAGADAHNRILVTMVEFIVRRLADEYPQLFHVRTNENSTSLHCLHTQEVFEFDKYWSLIGSRESATPAYQSAMDALASQVSEDIVLIQQSGSDDSLVYGHVSMPSGWRPDAMVAANFAQLHAKVPGFAVSAKQGQQHYVDGMINAVNGRQRFIWGLQPDNGRNHYPGAYEQTGWSRGFEHGFLRVERQTVTGFPELQCALFLIRLYLVPLTKVRNEETRRKSLLSAVRRMTDDDAAYKGIASVRDNMAAWLS